MDLFFLYPSLYEFWELFELSDVDRKYHHDLDHWNSKCIGVFLSLFFICIWSTKSLTWNCFRVTYYRQVWTDRWTKWLQYCSHIIYSGALKIPFWWRIKEQNCTTLTRRHAIDPAKECLDCVSMAKNITEICKNKLYSLLKIEKYSTLLNFEARVMNDVGNDYTWNNEYGTCDTHTNKKVL